VLEHPDSADRGICTYCAHLVVGDAKGGMVFALSPVRVGALARSGADHIAINFSTDGGTVAFRGDRVLHR
jgi:hypothetical protein